jgi:hypothetical protein
MGSLRRRNLHQNFSMVSTVPWNLTASHGICVATNTYLEVVPWNQQLLMAFVLQPIPIWRSDLLRSNNLR